MGSKASREAARIKRYEEDVEAGRQRLAQLRLTTQLKKIKKAKLIEAVTMVANHVYQYAPITVQVRDMTDDNPFKPPRPSALRWATKSVPNTAAEMLEADVVMAEETYIWIVLDEALLEDPELLNQYPTGVSINNDGDVFVPEYLCYPARELKYALLPISFLPPERPSPPFILKAAPTTLELGWTVRDEMIDRHELQFFPLRSDRCGAQIWRTASNDIPGAQFTMTDMPINTPFHVRLRSHSPFGWSELSSHVEVATTPAPPEQVPEAPEAEIREGGVVVLTWVSTVEDNGAEVTSFTVKGKAVGPENQMEVMYEGPVTMCELPDLKPGAIYHFQVAAVNRMGMGELSEVVTVTMPMQHQSLNGRVVPANALRVMGDWVELWDDEKGGVYYMHLKTGVKRKEAPKLRASAPRTVLLGAPSPASRTSSPRSLASAGSSPRLRASSPLPSLRGRGAMSSPRIGHSHSARFAARSPSPLRLRHGRSGSLGFGESKQSPRVLAMSPVAASDSPEARFRKKRYRFLCSLRRRTSGMRPGTPTVSTSVLFVQLQREHMFEESLEKITAFTCDDLTRKLRIDYFGEEGIDAGGLTKDWYLQLSRELFRSERGLFKRAEGDVMQFTVHPSAVLRPDAADVFKFIGRLLGKAVFDVQLVDLPFSHMLYKQLLGQKVGYSDLKDVDPIFCKSLDWMMENDITDIVHESFSVREDHEGKIMEVPLKPGGEEEDVTEANKAEYISLLVQYKTHDSVAVAVEAMKAGFYEVVPWEAVRIFSVDELELLLNGKPEIDLEDLQRTCKFKGGFSGTSPAIVWFWEAMESFEQQLRGKVLQFVTGTSRVPLDGFNPPLTFTPASDLGEDALPKAHTCFNQIVLPPYPSIEVLKDKLTYAVTHAEGFLLG